MNFHCTDEKRKRGSGGKVTWLVLVSASLAAELITELRQSHSRVQLPCLIFLPIQCWVSLKVPFIPLSLYIISLSYIIYYSLYIH